MSKLHELLVSGDKKKIFNFANIPSIGYPSGLLPLDYSNGYWVHVNNKEKKGIPDRWLNIGTQGGTFYTIIGNSGVAKTTLAVQIGSAEVRDFTTGDFYHIDAEGTSNPTRVQQLNRYSDDMMNEKYHFPDVIYVEDVFKLIYDMAKIKVSDSAFSYHTGYYDQFGNEIVIPQPTVVLIDSLPSLQTKDVEDSDELGSQTYNMRLAIAYNTFYKRLRPIIRDANITVMAINHLKEKPELGFVKTQAKIQYLKPNENIPGGSGPIYYSQNLLRMIYRGKFTEEKHGFGGFMVEAQNLKSKTNKSGTSVKLIFHEKYGFEPMLTLMQMAEDYELIKGRNPYCYLESNPELKFNTKDISYVHNPDIQAALVDACKPLLYNMISDFDPSQEMLSTNELLARLDQSFQVQDAGKDDLVADGPKSAASMSSLKSLKKCKKRDPILTKHMFYGMHNFNGKKQPAIEQILESRIKSRIYLEDSIRDMWTVPYIPGTHEVGFRV